MPINIGSTPIQNIMLGAAQVQKVMLGTVQIWPAGGGIINGASYEVYSYTPGGGTVAFTMQPTGATEGDPQGWYSPITPGIGAGKWVLLTETGGNLPMSGSAIGTRIELNVVRSWVGTSSTGVKFKDFLLEIFDAPSGGNLLASSTLHLEIDLT